MKRKIFALLLCMVFICTLSLPVYADSTTTSSDGYSALISDIPKTCPTCGSSLHASWFSTSGAEVELTISDNGTIKIPAGAGVVASIRLYCTNCKYEKTETRLLGLDWGSERPGEWKVEKAPTGIGRKDLPGYADDNGTPAITANGEFFVTANCVNINSLGESASYATEVLKNNPKHISVNSDSISSDSWPNYSMYLCYEFTAPVDGTYSYYAPAGEYLFTLNVLNDSSWKTIHAGAKNIYLGSDITSSSLSRRSSFVKGDKVNVCVWIYGEYPRWDDTYVYGRAVRATGHPIIIKVIPLESNKQTTITINNNTWNGNIYTDNSTNLTYIYPQYTTINEKNETVTNISNTPIIYNNETKQYYTYDQTTKNYYYITYNSDPAPSPTPTPDPTDKPGGSISTPETGKPGNSSGSSWWDKLLDKIGNAVIDGLLGAVSAVLKLIFKLLSTILGWIIWAVSLVFTLLPFLPPGLSGLLVGGVVVCFVIGIIKFIRG